MHTITQLCITSVLSQAIVIHLHGNCCHDQLPSGHCHTLLQLRQVMTVSPRAVLSQTFIAITASGPPGHCHPPGSARSLSVMASGSARSLSHVPRYRVRPREFQTAQADSDYNFANNVFFGFAAGGPGPGWTPLVAQATPSQNPLKLRRQRPLGHTHQPLEAQSWRGSFRGPGQSPRLVPKLWHSYPVRRRRWRHKRRTVARVRASSLRGVPRDTSQGPHLLPKAPELGGPSPL